MSGLASFVFDTPAIAGVRVEVRTLAAFKEVASNLLDDAGHPCVANVRVYTSGHAGRVFDAMAWEIHAQLTGYKRV